MGWVGTGRCCSPIIDTRFETSFLDKMAPYDVASDIWQALGWGMLVTNDESLKAYLVDVLQQINDWLMAKMLQKLVLVITVGRCWLTQ